MVCLVKHVRFIYWWDEILVLFQRINYQIFCEHRLSCSVICVCHYYCFKGLVSPMCVAYGKKVFFPFSRKNGELPFLKFYLPGQRCKTAPQKEILYFSGPNGPYLKII